MLAGEIAPDDPRAGDVRQLLGHHLGFVKTLSPPEDVHALDVAGLLVPAVSLFSLRSQGILLGVAAIRELSVDHGEIKSMHTLAKARGQGVGRALLDHLLAVARQRGYRRVSLETGSMPGFAPARALYAAAGFVYCGPFADYVESPNSAFMTLELVSHP